MEGPGGGGRRLRTRPPTPRSKPLLYLLLSLPLFVLFVYRSPFASFSSPPLPSASLCSRLSLSDERFLWYAPHSGFTNQVSELKNALLIGTILNRTVIVPPVLDHHAVALGSCPKFRVTSPATLRAAVWDHITELVRDQRIGVAPIEEKLVQHRLRWFGYLQRRPPEEPVRIGITSRVESTRRGRGRSKLTWKEAVKKNLKE